MSKGSFILQGTTGKVGSLVAQRRKGQTILKEYVKPANPKTSRQIAQRIVFATVMQAAKFMKPIVDHSFENYAKGQDSLNRFAKVNLDRLRAYTALDYQNSAAYSDALAFLTTKNISALIPNRYIMAQGSLVLDPKSANSKGVNNLMPFTVGNSIQYTAEGTTLGQVLNAFYGYTRPGQQLTKCFIVCRSGQGYNIYVYGGVPSVPGTVIPSFSFIAARLVLKDGVNWNLDVHAMEEAALKAAILDAFDAEKSDAALLDGCCSASRMTVDEGEISLDAIQNVKQIFNIPEAAFIAAETTILSEPYGANWLRSNAEMSLVDVPNPHNNYGLTWYEAQRAWVEGSVNADPEKFLNVGGDQNQVGF